MMNASARTPRRGRRDDSSSIGGHSDKDASLLSASTTCTSSERATTSAVAFEASPYLFFSEMESVIDLNGLSQGIVTYNATELIVDRVQRRLLDKHITAGRLVSAFSAIDVADSIPGHPLDGDNHRPRAFRSTLSFSKNPNEIGSDTDNAYRASTGQRSNRNEVTFRLQNSECAAAVAAGRALLKK